MLRYLGFCLLLTSCANLSHAQPAQVRLYTLDCGSAELANAAAASDTGELDGQARTLADPCFLIHHPSGWLLWDAGLAPDTPNAPGFVVRVDASLAGQLDALGLRPADIRFVAFSHLHFDHVGNANLFTHSTWLLNRDELAWAEHEPAHVSIVPGLFSAYRNVTTKMIDGDYDVFGDGTVRIFHAPGHTPGSAVLWIDLAHTGPVLLSGDLYLARESRRFGYVPSVNADRADTLASMARIERIVKRTRARVIVQHDPHDFASLPRVPGFLE